MGENKRKNTPPLGSVDAYRRTDVFTANRETILLMLYAGAIRFLKQAIEAAEKNDIVERARLSTRVLEIVNELRATLNYNTDSSIATHLESLYVFIEDRLIQGGIQNKMEYFRESLDILLSLQQTWEQAILSLKSEMMK